MKQHITKSDLEMLNEGGKARLKTWCISKSPDNKAYDESQLSIGQMIEFLNNNNYDVHTCKKLEDNARYVRRFNHNYGQVWAVREHFCDALWEAVKEVLNRDEK